MTCVRTQHFALSCHDLALERFTCTMILCNHPEWQSVIFNTSSAKQLFFRQYFWIDNFFAANTTCTQLRPSLKSLLYVILHHQCFPWLGCQKHPALVSIKVRPLGPTRSYSFLPIQLIAFFRPKYNAFHRLFIFDLVFFILDFFILIYSVKPIFQIKKSLTQNEKSDKKKKKKAKDTSKVK